MKSLDADFHAWMLVSAKIGSKEQFHRKTTMRHEPCALPYLIFPCRGPRTDERVPTVIFHQPLFRFLCCFIDFPRG